MKLELGAILQPCVTCYEIMNMKKKISNIFYTKKMKKKKWQR